MTTNFSAFFLLAANLLQALSPANGYHYVGCYADSGNRDLPVMAGSGSMSAARCNQLCTGRHYKYFGLQYTNECWCGNSYGKHGYKPNGECNMRCSGLSSQMCGAGWRNSVYASDYVSVAPLRDSMAAKVRSMYAPIPGGVVCGGCLITAFQHQKVGHSSDDFPVSELNSRLSRYPAKARDKLRVLQFGANAKTTFEDSTINIGPNHAMKSTYFGMAQRVGSRVHLGMVSTDISATLVHKYNVFTRRVCRRILFWKKCKNHTIRERRGYHGDEIRLIDTALQSETMRMFTENLGHIKV